MSSIREQVFALSLEEKLQLVQDLWDDIAANPERLPIPEWHKEELDRRQAELDRDPSAVLTWDETMAWIRARRAR